MDAATSSAAIERQIQPSEDSAASQPSPSAVSQMPLHLPIKPWQTRIICLHPGARSETLRASMHKVVLIHPSIEGILLPSKDEVISYEALSYTWGDAGLTRPLVLNNQQIAITTNLYDALLDLRNSTRPRWLWIDAICINQRDLDEKAQQVRNMFAIYQKAARVIVWLGLSTEDVRLAAEWLKATASIDAHNVCWPIPEEDFYRWRRRISAVAENNKLDGGARKMLEVFGINQPSEIRAEHEEEMLCRKINIILQGIQQGLEWLSTCTWPKRIWVVQEVHAARSIAVCCGSAYMDWYHLMGLDSGAALLTRFSGIRYGRYIESHTTSEAAKDGRDALGVINSVALSRLQRSMVGDANLGAVEPPLRLLELIDHFQPSEATILHDKIYALLAMSSVNVAQESKSEQLWKGIEISYRIPVMLLFFRVTVYLLQRFMSLKLLLSNAYSILNVAHCSSWTRDFRNSSLQDINYTTLFRDSQESHHFKMKGFALTVSAHEIAVIGECEDIIGVKKVDSYLACDTSRLQLVRFQRVRKDEDDLSRSRFRSASPPVQRHNEPGNVIWIATDAVRPGDIVVRARGSRCPIALRQKENAYYFLGGVRPLRAGRQTAAQVSDGMEIGAIRVSFRDYDGYFDFHDIPMSEPIKTYDIL